MTGRITAANPGSAAATLRWATDEAVLDIALRHKPDTVYADLSTVLDVLDIVHDAATQAAAFGHPLDPAVVLAALTEALGRES